MTPAPDESSLLGAEEPELLNIPSRLGLLLAAWSERWFPDPLIFALLGIVCVFCIGIAMGEKPGQLAVTGGMNFWALVPFTMQMAFTIIGGYVVASAPLVKRGIRWLARRAKTPRGAIALVALCSMLSSLISGGFSLIFSGVFVRELSKHVKGMDYRAAGAAGYLGLGAVWALGLSSSAPPPEKARTAEYYNIESAVRETESQTRRRPGEWLEYSPVLTILVSALLGWYILHVFRASPVGALAALDLNTYNLIFVTAGLLLHWRPRQFIRAVSESIPATEGVILQFPFYAVIFGMIVGTGISDRLAKLILSVSSPGGFPVLVAAYSAALGIFIPSGGSKWIIEAPAVLQAANILHVHLGWVVQIYNASEALPNLINPFWMLPLLGILKLKARD